LFFGKISQLIESNRKEKKKQSFFLNMIDARNRDEMRSLSSHPTSMKIYSSGSAAALTRRRGPRVDGAFGFENVGLAAVADASG